MGIFSLFGKAKKDKQFETAKEIASQISDIANNFLLLELMAYDTDNLPDRATDKWSLGFVAGVIDALLDGKNLQPNSIEGRIVMIMVYTRIFGSSSYSETSQSLWKSSDATFFEGMKAGGNDIIGFNNESNPIPRAWFDHIKNKD